MAVPLPSRPTSSLRPPTARLPAFRSHTPTPTQPSAGFGAVRVRTVVTGSGWGVLVGVVVGLVLGALFALPEVSMAAVCAGGVFVAGLLQVRFRRLDLSIRRRPDVHRIPVHGTFASELEVTNHGRRRSPPLWVRDTGADLAVVQSNLAPVPPGGGIRLRGRLTPRARGRLRLGPVQVEHADAFALVRREMVYDVVDDILVLPAFWKLGTPDEVLGADHERLGSRSRVGAAASDDFYALRVFEPGDDLRRVHWPSTARAGEPMVRQYDEPRLGRITVFIDNRQVALSADDFEGAVSAAASVVRLAAPGQILVRLVTAEGFDSGPVTGSFAVDHLMDELAVIAQVDQHELRAALRVIAQEDSGLLACCVGRLTVDEADLLASVVRTFAPAMVIDCQPHPTHLRDIPGRWGDQTEVEWVGRLAEGWSRMLGRAGGRPTRVHTATSHAPAPKANP